LLVLGWIAGYMWFIPFAMVCEFAFWIYLAIAK